MALRNILTEENPQLYKVSRAIESFTPHIHQLLDDMRETLQAANGVGLAAPQVGILRRAVIVLETNVPEGEQEYFIELLNPEIVSSQGKQTGPEGCLSVPGIFGLVTRPEQVKVRAQDRFGNWFEVEGVGLTARAFCHEIDHLNGHLFRERAIRILTEEEMMAESEDSEDSNEDGSGDER